MQIPKSSILKAIFLIFFQCYLAGCKQKNVFQGDIELVDVSQVEVGQDCREFINELKLSKFNITMGFIRVPENWRVNFPDRMLYVFYYLIHGDENKTTVFFNGGPGASSHSSFRRMAEYGRLGQANFLFFDQRGRELPRVTP